MKKKLQIGIMILIVVILAFLYAHIDKNIYLYDRDLDTGKFISTGILNNNSLSQTFNCSENVLDGLNVKCTIVGKVSGVSLEYSVIDRDTGAILTSARVDAAEIVNNRFHMFGFEQLKNTKGRNFIFNLQEVGSTEGNGVSFYITDEVNNGNQLIIKGNETQGTLIARTVSRRFDLETFAVVLLFVVYIVAFFKLLYKLFK